MRILIADDDPTFVLLIEKILCHLGHSVVVARDGLEAWEIAKDQAFPIVLTDWMMPGIDGLELCRRIRSVPDGAYTYVLMLTCKAGRQDRLEALQAGVDDFLTKPVDKEELSARLKIAQRVLETQQKLAEKNRELRASEERFRSVAQSAHDAIITIDEHGIILFWNRGAQEIFGYAEEEVLGRPIALLMPEQYRPGHRKALERLRRNPGLPAVGRTVEVSGLRKDGSEFPLELSLASWTTTEGTFYSGIIRDISRRKEAERKLAAERALLRTLIDSLPDYIYIKDQQGRYLLDNVAHRRLLGAESPEGIVGKTAFDFFPESLARQFHADDAGVLRTGTPLLNREEIVYDAAGRERWVATNKVPLKDDAGNIVGVVCMSRDVTERKRVEEQLRLQATALEAAANAIMITDRDGTILWVNPAFTRLTGYSADEVVGRKPNFLKSDAHDSSFFKKMWKTILSGEVWRGEVVNRRKDGTLYTEEMSITPVRNQEGEITHFIGLKQDISARKNAEEELRRAHSEIECLLSSISSILIGLDTDGKITRWNAAAESTFGIAAAHALGLNFSECGIEWDWDLIEEHLTRCRQEDRPIRLDEIRYTCPDGKERFLTLTVGPIKREEGQISGLLLLGTDITERKFLESQLAQAQKLESIGQLAAGIAHEINTPTQYVGDNTRFLRDAFTELRGLLEKYAQLAEAAKSGEVTPELLAEVEATVEDVDVDYLQQEIPKAIDQSLEGVERVATIVRAMKEFSHPGVEEKTATDINKAIESTITVARNEWKYVAEVVTDFDPDLPLVPCLAGEFNQVILNIIINAAHAIADVVGNDGDTKGTIKISTRRDGDAVEIRISDTGTGIPEENRDKIFDPFFTTKEVGKGTGQGLAIAHSVVVRKHGGSIAFETEVGKGTTFIIRLPIRSESTQRREAA